MQAVVWTDYLCPWCYLGLDRTALLRDLDVEVIELPYELHPDIPSGGVDVHGGRADALYRRIEAECEEIGLPFVRPTHIPNTRAVLEMAEWVRQNRPSAFPELHRRLFAAHFVEGLDLGDPAVVDEVLEASGAQPAELRAARESGEGWGLVDGSMAVAREMDVTGTPAWVINGSLLIPGVQPRDLFVRAVTKLKQREAEAG